MLRKSFRHLPNTLARLSGKNTFCHVESWRTARDLSCLLRRYFPCVLILRTGGARRGGEGGKRVRGGGWLALTGPAWAYFPKHCLQCDPCGWQFIESYATDARRGLPPPSRRRSQKNSYTYAPARVLALRERLSAAFFRLLPNAPKSFTGFGHIINLQRSNRFNTSIRGKDGI